MYFTETTVTMCAYAAEQAASPLWFFLLQFDSGDHSAHEGNIPCGFWSSEKDPASVPVDFIFDQTPQFVPIEEGEEAPLFTSTQVLGDLVFTTQTKYASVSISGFDVGYRINISFILWQNVYCNFTVQRGRVVSIQGGFATNDNSNVDNTRQIHRIELQQRRVPCETALQVSEYLFCTVISSYYIRCVLIFRPRMQWKVPVLTLQTQYGLLLVFCSSSYTS